jgi:GNAT superfamily N-acetyltransferase
MRTIEVAMNAGKPNADLARRAGVAGGLARLGAAPAEASIEPGLERLIEVNESEAYRSFFDVASRLHGREAFEAREFCGLTLLMSPLLPAAGVFNRVLGLGVDTAVDVPLLHELADRYRSRGCAMALELAPAALSIGTSMCLRELGLRRAATSAMLCRRGFRGLGPLVDSLFSSRRTSAAFIHARRAESADERKAVAAICARVFRVEPAVQAVLEALDAESGWQHWLATIDGQPAGAAMSFVRAPFAWFGWAATLPEYRSRGVKGALTDVRIAHALDARCCFITSDTAVGTRERPDHSLRSLTRRGFEVVHPRATYLEVPRMHATLPPHGPGSA